MKTIINLCLNDFNQPSLSDVVENKSKHRILHSYWPLNWGENNRRTLIGMAEKWPRSLNRGGRLKRVLFTVLY